MLDVLGPLSSTSEIFVFFKVLAGNEGEANVTNTISPKMLPDKINSGIEAIGVAQSGGPREGCIQQAGTCALVLARIRITYDSLVHIGDLSLVNRPRRKTLEFVDGTGVGKS